MHRTAGAVRCSRFVYMVANLPRKPAPAVLYSFAAAGGLVPVMPEFNADTNSSSHRLASFRGALQDAEEVYEILLLLVREPNLEAAIVKLHQLGQIAGGTVDEVGRAGRESTELLHQDGTGIRAFTGNEGTAGVLC